MNADSDVVTQRVRNRTVLLCHLSRLLKRGLVNARDIASDRDIHRLNFRTGSAKFQGTYRVYCQIPDGGSALCKAMSEAHSVAFGMCGGNQLFGAGLAIGLFGARSPCNWEIFDRSAARTNNSALSLRKAPFPGDLCATFRFWHIRSFLLKNR